MLLSLLHEALISIMASRLRTFLAMLGIVIGVSSVVLMLAIGSGSRAAIEESVAKLGSNLLVVVPGSREAKGLRSNEYSDLTRGDAIAIGQLRSVNLSAPATRPKGFQIVAGKNNWSTQVTGVTPEFFEVRNMEFAEGQNFTAQDIQDGTRNAIIGPTIVERVYEGQSPIGRNLRIGQLTFRVIGVLEAKGQDLAGRDQDDAVFIPLPTAQRKLFGDFWRDNVPMIFVQAASREDVDYAQEDIMELLRDRHKLRAADADRFTVRNLTAITQTATETANAFSILLGSIASISLIVGGIGIMNIMLVTVTERTREIGIRKAIGATEAYIMHQFLLEAVMIAGLGSAIGLLVGIGGAYGVKYWLSMPAQITLAPILLSLAVAVMVGVLSGLYPAQRAARLQPIEALRTIGA